MSNDRRYLLGEWRQIKPGTGRETVFIEFMQNGRLEYTVEGETKQQIHLTYDVVGDMIITDQLSAPRKESTRFHFENSDRLVLEREGENHVYARSSGVWPPHN